MSELWHYLGKPRPAYEPITTKGNAFWRGDRRFLIKGVNYFLRQSPPGGTPRPRDPKIDPLCAANLDALRRDVRVLQELGLNTITVSALDPAEDHHEALKLLAEAGFYVLVTIGEDIQGPLSTPGHPRGSRNEIEPDFTTQPYYKPEIITRALELVNQLADYPNILGFVVCGDIVARPGLTKMAEVVRAGVRDTKSFLRRRGGRRVPVGVSVPERMTVRALAVQYFTAGSQADESRIDFLAVESWSWAYKSSFQISGWKRMVEVFREYPVPMFLSEYGTYVQKQRIWEEVECLYSPNMGEVFSGGCFYTYNEYGNQYGIVNVDEHGTLTRKPEFAALKRKFATVSRRRTEEVFGEHAVQDYTGWEGKFPEIGVRRWFATEALPDFPLTWGLLMQGFQGQRRGGEMVEGSEEPVDEDKLSTLVAGLNVRG